LPAPFESHSFNKIKQSNNSNIITFALNSCLLSFFLLCPMATSMQKMTIAFDLHPLLQGPFILASIGLKPVTMVLFSGCSCCCISCTNAQKRKAEEAGIQCLHRVLTPNWIIALDGADEANDDSNFNKKVVVSGGACCFQRKDC